MALTTEEVAQATYDNARKVFGLDWEKENTRSDCRRARTTQPISVVLWEVDTYETRGSAIDQDDLERIATLQELRGSLSLTDPDYNGERICKIIMQEVPQAKHAF